MTPISCYLHRTQHTVNSTSHETLHQNSSYGTHQALHTQNLTWVNHPPQSYLSLSCTDIPQFIPQRHKPFQYSETTLFFSSIYVTNIFSTKKNPLHSADIPKIIRNIHSPLHSQNIYNNFSSTELYFFIHSKEALLYILYYFNTFADFCICFHKEGLSGKKTLEKMQGKGTTDKQQRDIKLIN